MPRRNLIIICSISVISLLCYKRANLNRYGNQLAQAMNIVDAQYVRPVKRRELYENAMHGMIGSLDQYSAYISPKRYGAFVEELDQEFGGVGMMVEPDEESGRLRVALPLPGTPAYRAGVQVDDLLMSIDDHDTAGMVMDKAIELMRGKPGEIVRLAVLHLGDSEPVELEIARSVIPIESVRGDLRRRDGTWDYRLQADPRIAYIRLLNFGEHTVDEFKQAIRAQAMQAIILDLRGNAGGLLKAAVAISDMFIDRGMIVSTRGRGGKILEAYQATPEVLIAPDLPMVVLIDGDSASASEIVAACLQDHGRAVVVGMRSWGKGTVQNVIPIEGGSAALKLTIATYWRPSGKDIHRSEGEGEDDEWGVSPDEGFVVEVSDDERKRVLEQRAHRDVPPSLLRPQTAGDGPLAAVDRPLQKAIEFLQQQLDAQDKAPTTESTDDA